MSAEDYEVTQEDASKWASRVQEDESQNRFQNSATDEAADDWESGVSGAGSSYASGVADYAGISEDDVAVTGSYTGSANDENSAKWRSGVSGAGERWADGVQGKQDEYLEGTEDAGQDWFNNYVAGVQGE